MTDKMTHKMTKTYKINIIGDAGVGKSVWIHKMKTDEFEGRYFATVGRDVHPFAFGTNHGDILVELHDYAGQEKYSSLSGVQPCDATVLMFDLTSNTSHKNLADWHTKCCRGEPVFVVGNKCDIDDIRVTPTFHAKHGLPYLALSAKTMTYVDFLTHILRRLTGHDDLVILP